MPFEQLFKRSQRSDENRFLYYDDARLPGAVKSLLSAGCQVENCCASFADMQALKKHVGSEHDLYFWFGFWYTALKPFFELQLVSDICLQYKRVFPREQKLFSKSQLHRHLQQGDDSSFRGHPRCNFCNTRYYGADELFDHCRKNHFTCHLCEQAGIRDRYLKDYAELVKMFVTSFVSVL